jgi:hypothetical protein
MMNGSALTAAPGPPLTPLKLSSLPKPTITGWYPSPLNIPLIPPTTNSWRNERQVITTSTSTGITPCGTTDVIFGFYQFRLMLNLLRKPGRILANEDLILCRLTPPSFGKNFTCTVCTVPTNSSPNGQIAYTKPYLQQYSKDFLTLPTSNMKNTTNNPTTIQRFTPKLPGPKSVEMFVRANQQPISPSSPKAQFVLPSTETYYSQLQEADNETM